MLLFVLYIGNDVSSDSKSIDSLGLCGLALQPDNGLRAGNPVLIVSRREYRK